MKEYNLPIVIEYDAKEKIYLAECPVLPGCYTDGETYEAVVTNIRDAIQLMIESRLAVGDPIPMVEMVTVAA